MRGAKEREDRRSARRAPSDRAQSNAESRSGRTATHTLLRICQERLRVTSETMETSINMRVFKTILLLIALATVSVDASPLLHYTRDRDSRPADRNEPSAPVELKKDATDHYDQRQNGTENYRVKVDGLVFIMAPADSLLLAGAALEPSNFNFEQILGEANKPISKPKPDDDAPQPKPQKDSIPKSSHHDPIHAGHKSVLRISNLIAPFLKRMHHSQQSTK